MRVLLDTHAFLWWIDDSPKLPDLARDVISGGKARPVFSVVSGWEITVKVGLERLELPDAPGEFLTGQLSRNDVEVLPIYLRHALRVHELPGLHGDPFDRLLIAQGSGRRGSHRYGRPLRIGIPGRDVVVSRAPRPPAYL